MLKRKIPVKIIKLKFSRDVKHFSAWQLLVSFIIFAAIGGYLTYRSFAYIPLEPTAYIISDDSVFISGASPTLTYSATNATSCSINGVPVSVAGDEKVYTAPAVKTNTSYNLSCSGPGGSVNVSTRIAVSTNPNATTSADTTNQTTTGTVYANKVNFIRFCASDVCRADAPNEPSLLSVKNSVRNWYTGKVGKPFYAGAMDLKVVRGNHTAYWYTHTGSYPLLIQRTVQNVSNYLNNNGKVPAGNIVAVVLGFPVNDHCGSGFTGAGETAIKNVSTFDSYENVSVTDPFRCTGAAFISAVAHELGHNFGLQHNNMPGGASCSSTSPKRNSTLMDCYYACNGHALTECKLNGYAYRTNIPDWKLLANYSPFFH